MASNKAKLLEEAVQNDLHPFAARMSPTPPAESTPSQESLEPRNLGKLEPTLEGRKEGSKEKSKFELSERPYKNNTFSFTKKELETLEDIKIDLSRKLDIKTSMNEIVRASLHRLFRDYEENGDQSDLVKRIRERGRR